MMNRITTTNQSESTNREPTAETVHTMRIITTSGQWRHELATLGASSIGLVPTMGALHEGHLSLVRRSRIENDITVVSIYVNPTQFNNPHDLDSYPRTLDDDYRLLEREGTDYLYLPDYHCMYPDGYRYRLHEIELSTILCGASRPGHFDGVLSVVLKLLAAIGPHRAYFGEKDYQQYLLVDGMVKAFQLPTAIVPCPILRESSGLAMSSRNRLLSSEEKRKAPEFHRILDSGTSIEGIRQNLEACGFIVDYVEEHFGRVFGAVVLGHVRLIDNIPRKPEARQECFGSEVHTC